MTMAFFLSSPIVIIVTALLPFWARVTMEVTIPIHDRHLQTVDFKEK
jgi:hypothetical protein